MYLNHSIPFLPVNGGTGQSSAMERLCVSKKFTLFVFTITKSDVDQF